MASTAIPAFTRGGNDKSFELVHQQISELQQAAAGNAESVRLLAEQMQQAVSAIEAGAEASQRALLRAQLLAGGALLVALGALGLSLFILLR